MASIPLRGPEPAEEIIIEMDCLLRKRFKHRVSRAVFLKRWTRLRNRLSATEEYKSFRHRVIARAGGRCEAVGCTSSGAVVHHRTPVARAPWRALEDRNGMFVCHSCHAAAHPHLKLRLN